MIGLKNPRTFFAITSQNKTNHDSLVLVLVFSRFVSAVGNYIEFYWLTGFSVSFVDCLQ